MVGSNPTIKAKGTSIDFSSPAPSRSHHRNRNMYKRSRHTWSNKNDYAQAPVILMGKEVCGKERLTAPSRSYDHSFDRV